MILPQELAAWAAATCDKCLGYVCAPWLCTIALYLARGKGPRRGKGGTDNEKKEAAKRAYEGQIELGAGTKVMVGVRNV